MINLDQLRIFQAVAQKRNFTRAAEAVHLTQPGISKHIKQMEDYFGVPLFDRSGKKVTLTEAGAVLLEATQEIMATIEAAERSIDDLKGLRGGRLRLGSSFPIGVYILPRVLAEFRRRHPAVEVALEIVLSDAIGAKILANEIDLGLASYEPRDPRLVAREFMTDELVVIVPPGHPWGTKRHIAPEDMAGETFIVAARGAGTRTVVEERLKARGVVLPKVLEFGNLEGVKHAVEEGLGASVQARSVAQREVEAGTLHAVPLIGMETAIQFYYVQRKNTHLTHAARELVGLLEAASPSARP
ncbi:MAG TPA: LysR substrate-binding domain-containing protein [Candidatus Angelobacter sp.]|nr:LysR substrate-binding domain-containing protein [Candidatus Angelobacter sp.]